MLTRRTVGLRRASGRAMLASMSLAKPTCIDCGAPTERRSNALRCLPCARAAKVRRNRARMWAGYHGPPL